MSTEIAKPRSWISSGKSALRDCRKTFKEGGIRAVIKRYGWKIFAVFFVYYLIRDLILYVLVPYLIARHFLG